MNDSRRWHELLVKAAQPVQPHEFAEQFQDDVDTSCPYVPFGFVSLRRRRLLAHEMPDDFWAHCLAADECVDVLPASIHNLDFSRLTGIFSTIHSDLARAGKAMDLEWLTAASGLFRVADGCASCCGEVLLFRGDEEAAYLHWHRES